MKLLGEQFTRGENPLKALNIGKRVEIENWFKTWVPYANYEIDDNLNIKVKNYLWLKNCLVTYLPDNLHIEGWLDIRNTNITSLPNNLYIEENLHMGETNITSLPNDLYVGREIFRNF